MRGCCILVLLSFIVVRHSWSQVVAKPCATDPVYRAFDFWVGEWEAFAKNNNKAGDSRISIILDSCIILEEWTGARGYSGKSYNTYNAATGQWQQTWVDNNGGSTAYLNGIAKKDTVIFYSSQQNKTGKTSQLRLSFYKLDANTVRQHGEHSDDAGITWMTDYDLEYRRKQ